MARTSTNNSYITSGRDCRNKCVFSFHRNTVSDEEDIMSFRRLFYRFGPAEGNDRLPTVTRRDGIRWLMTEVDSEMACQQCG